MRSIFGSPRQQARSSSLRWTICLAARSNSRPRSVYRTSFIPVEVTEQIVFTSLVVELRQMISTDLSQ
jgi:hypothetical protein